ncbi:MAG: nitroreductase family protein, partial [Hyphomicrobiaceae bacterium]
DTPSGVRLEAERARLLRAPMIVSVISSINRDRGVPENEQILSAGAACMNLCHAANAMGFGTSWITEWYAYSHGIRQVLGLSENESVAGFIYIGTAKEKQTDRERPMLASIVKHWTG